MKLRLCLLAAATLLAPAAAIAAPNLVTNGDFSTTSTTSSNGNFELTASGQYGTVAGWATSNSTTSNNPYNLLFTAPAAQSSSYVMGTAQSALGQYATAGNGNEFVTSSSNGFVTSPTGGNFMALDGDTNVNGNLSQVVNGLTQNGLYELDFYWAVAQLASRSGAVSDALSISFGNSAANTKTVAIGSGGFSGWMKEKYFFTAQAASQTLSFLSIGAPAGYPPLALLDGISVTAAPEPSALALLASGFGALAFFGRRRRASKTITA